MAEGVLRQPLFHRAQYSDAIAPYAGGFPLSIHLIRTALEGVGEAAEGGVEHGAHQQAERATLEFIRNEELDVAALLVDRPKGPAVVEPAERPVEVFDRNLQPRAVDDHAAREALADQ